MGGSAAEAWNRGDQEAALALFHAHLAPSFQLEPLYLDRVYTGIGALRQMWADATSTWQEYRSVVEEIADLEDRLLAVLHVTGRGAGGGVLVNQRIFVLMRFEGEEAVWAKSFPPNARPWKPPGRASRRCRRRTWRSSARCTGWEATPSSTPVLMRRRVSDGTRTRDRLNHNQEFAGSLGKSRVERPGVVVPFVVPC